MTRNDDKILFLPSIFLHRVDGVTVADALSYGTPDTWLSGRGPLHGWTWRSGETFSIRESSEDWRQNVSSWRSCLGGGRHRLRPPMILRTNKNRVCALVRMGLGDEDKFYCLE
ncbi:hypothetical protein TNIN_118891 [Trichonephila inaurata madagascariensis]|uniref:Uncharacterized protein n=1 Tax=Trichonephila inaurata madagascariensis TaxID=2747483 RepID=A0A8X6XGM4_9ARAC|nr:hypothetical protein TNIN_118891 [Trichonephila inaurata madagascariensis]